MELEENGERTVRVSTIELFFDLVFVFTLTQLTGLLAAEPNWRGLLQAAVLLSVIWWIYDGYLWLTNAIELEDAGHRLLLLGGMGGFLVMALAIPTAYEGSGLDFGLGYLLVVVLHGGLYMRETSPREAAAIRGIVPYNILASLVLVAGGAVGGDVQSVSFAAVAVLLWSVPFVVSLEGFRIAAAHFVERHGLVVIVALGESIVVLGVGAGGEQVGAELALVSLLGLALSASLWWTYFCEERGVEHALVTAPAARRPALAINYGYAHAFLLFAVVIVASGLKKSIPEPLDPFATSSALALAGGTAVYLLADEFRLRALGLVRRPTRIVAAVATAITVPLGTEVGPALQIAALAAVVTASVAWGRSRGRQA
jgi:low temperature requirement protein LtrA